MRTLKENCLLFLIIFVSGCAGLRYSQQAFDNDTKVKNEAMALIQKSNENYSIHQTEVETLKAEILQIYQDEQKRKGNSATVALWKEVIEAKGNLFDFLNLWQQKSTLSKSFADEASVQIGKLLSTISDLESQKKK